MSHGPRWPLMGITPATSLEDYQRASLLLELVWFAQAYEVKERQIRVPICPQL